MAKLLTRIIVSYCFQSALQIPLNTISWMLWHNRVQFSVRFFAVSCAVLTGLIYTLWRPPLYDYDGYMYMLQGLHPKDTLNAQHLLWLPWESLI